MIRFLYRHSQSIFTRLIIVLLVTAVLINIVVFRFLFRSHLRGDTSVTRSILHYVKSLADGLGSPPDKVKAAVLAKKLNMRITYSGKTVWSVGGEGLVIEPGDKSAPEHVWHMGKDIKAAAFDEFHRFSLTDADGGVISFDLYRTPTEEKRMRHNMIRTLIAICLILTLAYWGIRWWLKPVKWLMGGAEAVRDGNLDYRVPVRRGGELRELAHTFNQMTERIRRTVSSQQRLMRDVSHELRTPITRMRLQLEMMPDSREVQSMREDLREMEDMIASILTEARMRHAADALHYESVDVGHLLHDIATRSAGRSPGVVSTLPDEPVMALVDPEKIFRVFSNIIDNALKYSEKDSSPVEVRLELQQTMLAVTVTDHGIGIPAKDLGLLFEPFYRVDSSRTRDTGGFGLGLSLCKSIVRAHGGEISIESVEGEGSTVTVRLPLEGDK